MTHTTAPHEAPEGYKWCPRCEEFLPVGMFPPYYGYCYNCKREYHRKWESKQRPGRAFIARARLIYEWGQKCFRCDETDPRVMELHHRDPELGKEHRGWNTRRVYDYARKNPDEFELLCCNCHKKESLPQMKIRYEELISSFCS